MANQIKDRARKTRLKHRRGSEPIDDSEQKPPVFSFEYLQEGWCIRDCNQEERSRMLDKIRRLSSLSWKEIKQQHRHYLGSELISTDSIRVPLPSFITEDVRLLAFRAIDKAPMVGYRKGRIFYVIWIDRTFTLYDHG